MVKQVLTGVVVALVLCASATAALAGELGYAGNWDSSVQAIRVTAVKPYSRAERMGLQPGDIIVEANGYRLEGPQTLNAVRTHADTHGFQLVFKVQRKGVMGRLTEGSGANVAQPTPGSGYPPSDWPLRPSPGVGPGYPAGPYPGYPRVQPSQPLEHHFSLGVEVRDARQSGGYRFVEIVRVIPGGLADRYGLQVGDGIYRFGKERVQTIAEFKQVERSIQGSTKLHVDSARYGRKTITVVQ